MRTDIHQHLWTEPLVAALAERRELPFVREEGGLTVLYLAEERPYVIDRGSEDAARRAALVEQDGVDRALVCLSSPLGIEGLPREQAQRLIDAYHDGALALGDPFGVWGSLALEDPDPEDVDHVLQRGCVGVCLPAGALAGVEELEHMHAVLARLEDLGAPLLVHPGPPRSPAARPALAARPLGEPLWWPALSSYVAAMQAAWLAFLAVGRSRHPHLRVVFTMLAGLAPLQLERIASRGGPAHRVVDPLLFYETSSYGPATVAAIGELVGAGQILYGSDRPVADPAERGMPGGIDWDLINDGTRLALGHGAAVLAR
jgi:hypothetical protein